MFDAFASPNSMAEVVGTGKEMFSVLVSRFKESSGSKADQVSHITVKGDMSRRSESFDYGDSISSDVTFEELLDTSDSNISFCSVHFEIRDELFDVKEEIELFTSHGNEPESRTEVADTNAKKELPVNNAGPSTSEANSKASSILLGSIEDSECNTVLKIGRCPVFKSLTKKQHTPLRHSAHKSTFVEEDAYCIFNDNISVTSDDNVLLSGMIWEKSEGGAATETINIPSNRKDTTFTNYHSLGPVAKILNTDGGSATTIGNGTVLFDDNSPSIPELLLVPKLCRLDEAVVSTVPSINSERSTTGRSQGTNVFRAPGCLIEIPKLDIINSVISETGIIFNIRVQSNRISSKASHGRRTDRYDQTWYLSKSVGLDDYSKIHLVDKPLAANNASFVGSQAPGQGIRNCILANIQNLSSMLLSFSNFSLLYHFVLTDISNVLYKRSQFVVYRGEKVSLRIIPQKVLVCVRKASKQNIICEILNRMDMSSDIQNDAGAGEYSTISEVISISSIVAHSRFELDGIDGDLVFSVNNRQFICSSLVERNAWVEEIREKEVFP